MYVEPDCVFLCDICSGGRLQLDRWSQKTMTILRSSLSFSWIRRMVAAVIMLFTFREWLLHFECCDQRYHPARQTDSKRLYSRSSGFYMCGVITHYCMCGDQNDDELPLRGDDGVKVSTLFCSSCLFRESCDLIQTVFLLTFPFISLSKRLKHDNTWS